MEIKEQDVYWASIAKIIVDKHGYGAGSNLADELKRIHESAIDSCIRIAEGSVSVNKISIDRHNTAIAILTEIKKLRNKCS